MSGGPDRHPAEIVAPSLISPDAPGPTEAEGQRTTAPPGFSNGNTLEPTEGPAAAPRGWLSVLLTDAPIPGQVTAVNVCIEQVSVVMNAGQPIGLVPSPRTMNLLALQNGVTEQLGIIELPTGIVHQLRLDLCEAGHTIVVDGIEHPLTIPSGTTTGIKLSLPGGFEIRDNLTTTAIIDFDAGKSVHYSRGNGYALVPVLRLQRALEVTILSPTAGDFVGAQPFDVSGSFWSRDTDPVVSVTVAGVPATISGSTYSARIRASLDAPTYSIVSVATTQAGITGAVSVTVGVDNVPPMIAIVEPLAGALIAPGLVQIAFAAADDVGIAEVVVFVDDVMLARVEPPQSFVDWDAGAIVPGGHTLRANAVDLSGNVTTSSAVSVVVAEVSSALSFVRAEPPVVVADGAAQSVITILLRDVDGRALAGVAADLIRVSATGSGNTMLQPTAATDASGRTVATLSSTDPELKRLSARIGSGGGSLDLRGPLVAFVEPMPGCGNGIVDPGEACDDGNYHPFDGCRADCRGSFAVEGQFAPARPTIDVARSPDNTFVVACWLCDAVESVSMHSVPDALRLDQYGAESAGSLDEIAHPDGLRVVATLVGHDLGRTPGPLALVFEVAASLDGIRSTFLVPAFFSVRADGSSAEMPWNDFLCASGGAQCGPDDISGSDNAFILPF